MSTIDSSLPAQSSDIPGVVSARWEVSSRVTAFTTTRLGGVSEKPFDSLNLGLHVGDDEHAVVENRRRLQHAFSLPGTPHWLNQTHGNTVCIVPRAISAQEVTDRSANRCADEGVDGAWTNRADQVLAVLTADCLPVVISDTAGSALSVVHAGWRGLAAGILEKALEKFDTDATLCAWLGPAIGPQAFEVGEDVRVAFEQRRPDHVFAFESTGAPGKYRADLYKLARNELQQCRSVTVTGGDYCTFSQSRLFHSHRRDGVRSGRMATVAWIAQPGSDRS